MTTGRRMAAGVAGAGAFLGFHAAAGGLRGDHVALAVAGVAAWLARGRLRPVANFWVPLLVMGAVYDAQRYWAEAVRGPIRVAEPLRWELAWFGIGGAGALVTPAQWLQRHTHAALDAVCGVAYLGFVPVFVGIGAWWRFKERRAAGQEMMWAMLWLNLAGYVTYLVYPAAPPWYVDHYGPGPVVLDAPPEAAGAARFDALFGVTWFAEFYGRSANVFGAIPSLHVGQTFLAVLYAWRLRSLRAVATWFWLVVFFASAYLNHHYLVDGIVGMAYAAAAFGAMEWRRRRASHGAGRKPIDAV